MEILLVRLSTEFLLNRAAQSGDERQMQQNFRRKDHSAIYAILIVVAAVVGGIWFVDIALGDDISQTWLKVSNQTDVHLYLVVNDRRYRDDVIEPHSDLTIAHIPGYEKNLEICLYRVDDGQLEFRRYYYGRALEKFYRNGPKITLTKENVNSSLSKWRQIMRKLCGTELRSGSYQG